MGLLGLWGSALNLSPKTSEILGLLGSLGLLGLLGSALDPGSKTTEILGLLGFLGLLGTAANSACDPKQLTTALWQYSTLLRKYIDSARAWGEDVSRTLETQSEPFFCQLVVRFVTNCAWGEDVSRTLGTRCWH